MHDQIQALNWLQLHLTQLGGDPTQVSISGCSAGALSACTLAVSPRAKGLFNRVILEAGACNGPWGPGGAEYGTYIYIIVIDQRSGA